MSPTSLDVNRSVAVERKSRRSVQRVLYRWPCGLLGNVPLLHTSILCPPTSPACDEFYQAFSRVSTATTNAGVRRPRNEAMGNLLHMYKYIRMHVHVCQVGRNVTGFWSSHNLFAHVRVGQTGYVRESSYMYMKCA